MLRIITKPNNRGTVYIYRYKDREDLKFRQVRAKKPRLRSEVPKLLCKDPAAAVTANENSSMNRETT
jgi:hypothetical protein